MLKNNLVDSRRAKAVMLVVVGLMSLAVSTKAAAATQVVPLEQPLLQTRSLASLAPDAFVPDDPSPCLKGGSDPNEQPLGGHSSRAVYSFASTPNLRNVYARLVYRAYVCTGMTLSGSDEKLLEKILAFFKVTDSRSFGAVINVTGLANGGVSYPTLVPFSYKYDTGQNLYTVDEIGLGATPWQVTSGFQVKYSYTSSKNVSINILSLYSSLVSAISGAGQGAALLSPASNAYLNAANLVLQDVAQSFFDQLSAVNDSYLFDILGSSVRSVTYRFEDDKNRPLAAVRIGVSFTNSIAYPEPIDPLSSSAQTPRFSNGLPDILSVSMGTGLGTLLQAISKESSFQTLLKSTASTTPASFASACQTLEGSLRTTYGLNDYDVALTMAEVLQQDTAYLTSKALYKSGCFGDRGLLKQMGIAGFDQPPAS